jgi:hypothetical protein
MIQTKKKEKRKGSAFTSDSFVADFSPGIRTNHKQAKKELHRSITKI